MASKESKTVLKWVDGRAFANHSHWECIRDGFLRSPFYMDAEVIMARGVLTNDDLFYTTCEDVVRRWPITAAVHLSNASINRRAWIGQASCFFHGASEEATRVCWSTLTMEQQTSANRVAEEFIGRWKPVPFRQ